jgi:hypothetical protein
MAFSLISALKHPGVITPTLSNATNKVTQAKLVAQRSYFYATQARRQLTSYIS